MNVKRDAAGRNGRKGYDLAVIGAGSAGFSAAITAAETLHHSRAASRFAGIAGDARLEDWAALVAGSVADVPYPTTAEGLKLAAQTFDKDVTKLSCCAG